MRETGIVRNLDKFGRIVVPIGIRRLLGVEYGGDIEIYVDKDRSIVLRPVKNDLKEGLRTFIKMYDNPKLSKQDREIIESAKAYLAKY